MLIQFLLVPLSVFAHGTNYLEFNPDQSSSLKVVDVAIPSQVFFAQNDFLGGFDLWLANSDSSGTTTFDLLNDQGAVLMSKTVTIPVIVQISNGNKFHVDFNSQTAILADKKYSIRITSSMLQLYLYYSERVKIISHDAPFVSEYITGVGKLGSEEQTFSFKYALYETTETSAPIVSNIIWTVLSPTQMRLDFNANEPVDYRIEYGLSGQGYTQSTSFLGDYQFCAPGISFCSIIIPVVSGTAYQYILTVKDSWGNQSQSTGAFQSAQSQTPTPSPTGPSSPTASPTVSPIASPTSSPTGSPTPDTTPPVISNLRVVAVTDKSVDIAWTTSEAANSHLLISTPSLITVTDVADSTFELEHLLKTGNLLGASTPYIAKVTSRDATNNERVVSISFTTSAFTPPPSSPQPSPTGGQQPLPPGPANQSSGSVSASSTPSGPGSSTGSVQWGTPATGEPSNGYRVDIFDKNGKLVKTILAAKGFHGAEIPGLADGEYSVIVYANNDGVFEKLDQPAELRIGEPSFITRIFSFWPYLLIVVILAGIFFWLRLKKRPPQITTQVLPS